jgi:hypothetical protein
MLPSGGHCGCQQEGCERGPIKIAGRWIGMSGCEHHGSSLQIPKTRILLEKGGFGPLR